MRWERLNVPNSEGQAWIKTLAKDEETGARTALIKFDPGFKQAKTTSAWPTDMYVLEGEMTCGSLRYGSDTYHYRPAGTEFGPIETVQGITRIIFTSDTKTESSPDEVLPHDVKLMPWGKSYSDPTGTGSRKLKDLRQDPIAGITLLIHSSLVPGLRGIPDAMHVHDHVEEYYVMEGEFDDYLGDIDAHIHSVPGMYVCRPPHESMHGDTLSIKTPSRLIVRRGWVGQADTFYDSLEKHSPNVPLAPVDFVE